MGKRKTHSVSFQVYKTGSVSMDNVRYGSSTAVARALKSTIKKKEEN